MKNQRLQWMKLSACVVAAAMMLGGCGDAAKSAYDETTVDVTADVQDEEIMDAETVDEDTQQDDENPDIDWEANDKSARPADWYELQQDGYILVLKLEDPADDAFKWILQNHYENVIRVDSEANEDGCYILTMSAAMDEAGDAQIALQYTDEWDENVQQTVVMDLFVNESGEISVETASRM